MLGIVSLQTLCLYMNVRLFAVLRGGSVERRPCVNDVQNSVLLTVLPSLPSCVHCHWEGLEVEYVRLHAGAMSLAAVQDGAVSLMPIGLLKLT